MKIAMFGYSGFIGSALTKSYVNQGYEVLCVGRTEPNIHSELITYISFDVNAFSNQSLVNSLAGVDCLVYLISTSTPNTSNDNPIRDINENLILFVEVLSAAVIAGVKRVVFSSSGGAIYSNEVEPPYDELSLVKPLTSYVAIKLSCEYYLEIFRKTHSISYAALRISNPYGPGQNSKLGFGVIPTFVKALYEGAPVNVYGDGSAIRDYLYIDDLVQAFLELTPITTSGIYNVGSGIPLSLLDLISALENVTGKEFDLKFHASRGTDVSSVYLDVNKIKFEIGWQAKIRLMQGLKKYINWFEEVELG